MNIQFAGTLQYQLQLSEVLHRVTEGTPEPLSGLLLTDEAGGRHGTIVITKSRFVAGAELKDANYNLIATGYEALRMICKLVSAQFKYVTAKPEFFENVELTLNIEIDQLLKGLPDLPEDPAVLQDPDALLDRVFSHEGTPLVLPVATEPQVAPAKPVKAKKKTWHSVPVRKAEEIYEKDTEPRYATMEERALAELGVPGEHRKPKKKSFVSKFAGNVGNHFYSAFSAPVYTLKKLAVPVFLPIVVLAGLYQGWVFIGPKLRAIKLPAAPTSTAKHNTNDHSARATSGGGQSYRAASAPSRRSNNSNYSYYAHPSLDPSHPPIDLAQPIRAGQVPQTPPPAAPYETPTEIQNLPHRRAYQAAPSHQ